MKFSGTQAQLFQAIQDGGKALEQRQKKEIKKVVKREVRKVVKPRQPSGISFDLFG
jgi:hypothetical protein